MPTTYEPVIGLEIHFAANTKTKLFCRCSNQGFDKGPNTNVCPICMGFPGMLPLMNEAAVEKGVKAALALGCEIPEFSKMDRKSYFYPDLPMGYQISQYDLPVSQKGKVTIWLSDGNQKEIGITRLHLENDAGKLTHTEGGSLVDYNRAGAPLMEIVSEPDLRSAEEASLYARELQKIMRYAGVSDADMEKGQMRFDANISIRPVGQKEFGTKTELKNLNSFRSLQKAIEYEIKRQTELLESGGQVTQETRGWDDVREVSVAQRSKEEAADYRYFPEPDIPPLVMPADQVKRWKEELPELPAAKSARYQLELGLPADDAFIIAGDRDLAIYYEVAVETSQQPKKTANWLLSELLGLLKAENLSITQSNLSPEHLGKLVKLIEEGAITNKIAKDNFEEIYKYNLDPEKFIEEKGLKVMNDDSELEKICQQVTERNPQIVEDFKGGKEKAIGGLVGQVMAATKGTANPQRVNEILRKLLS